MKKHDIDPPLTHALNEQGELKYVRDVPQGDECGCICPKCHEPLIAKHCLNEGKIPHFAHKSDSVCIGAQMSALHLLAQQIIKESKSVIVPKYNIIIEQPLEFVDVTLENQEEWKTIRPDIVGTTKDGLKWAIEIYYTNKIDRIKEEKIKNLGVICLEIDITGQTYESLENFLLNTPYNRGWINNPYYDMIIHEAKKKDDEEEEIKTINMNHSLYLKYDNLENLYNDLSKNPYIKFGSDEHYVSDFEITPNHRELWMIHYNNSYRHSPKRLTKFFIQDKKLWGGTNISIPESEFIKVFNIIMNKG